MKKKSKRSQIKRITRETIVLRWMRRSRGVSMRKAGLTIGVTSSAISHYEQGRMDLPRARIPELLASYRYTATEYEEYVAGKPLPVISVRDECAQIIQRLDSSKLGMLHALLLSFQN